MKSKTMLTTPVLTNIKTDAKTILNQTKRMAAMEINSPKTSVKPGIKNQKI